ncbi:hypothetical protein HDV62DRAFT_298540 [Trichoderma sp. SZMC 28011]
MSQTNHRQDPCSHSTQDAHLSVSEAGLSKKTCPVLPTIPLSLSLYLSVCLSLSLYLSCVRFKLHLRRCKIVAVCLSFIPPAHLPLLFAALSSQRMEECLLSRTNTRMSPRPTNCPVQDETCLTSITAQSCLNPLRPAFPSRPRPPLTASLFHLWSITSAPCSQSQTYLQLSYQHSPSKRSA